MRGTFPILSAWRVVLPRATRVVGAPHIRADDGRHAAATTWLRAGVPLAIVALRLGHRVETLVTSYVGAIDNDDETANALIDAAITIRDATGPP